LVALARGLAGKKAEHVQTAHALGLARFGDQTLGSIRDRAFMGRVRSIRHLLTVTYFDEAVHVRTFVAEPRVRGTRQIPGTVYSIVARSYGARGADWRDVVKREVAMIPVPDMSGRYYELSGEEYVQVETSEQSGVLIWSSDLSVDAVVERLGSAIGAPSPDDEGLLIDDQGHTYERPSDMVEAIAAKDPDSVRLLTAVHGDAVVSWRSAQIKMQDGHTPHVEICYAAADVDWTIVQRLVNLTGSAEVRRSLAKLKRPLIQSLGKHAVNH